ncbi:MAG: FMNH(2)-dependent dimethylsulfone monooxygenase [Chroococcidiopsis cubana SAG 39.79]|uniref:Dimethyl sulfone monooxygenase SfnG n=2 Tax=Chroococcidiopsis TaxID=54298 RepID=A0AB37UGK7_9CYAN|nr:dimethyl sulfone monooxygenase SfnG [Chroococcidiopsis cubana]MDZ4876584.1 FMNH(2)-dependent dimethylsulfone monooxygenase [Chroococcidiopsis cubana SAG 39.79]RUT10354.1 dimethyl sulfone monooxygenase SfnG [Chroococcidiopsis cubana SAG 39.79]
MVDIKFAYWVPNVSGGLVVSKIPQRTDWTYDYNAQLAQTAEQVGFDYALAQARFIASYGAEYQLEALTTVAALAPVTKKLKLIAAVHPGLWHPGVVAKMGATIDFLSQGRFCLNVVSGWFKNEFTIYGEPWLDHDERYRRSEEFIRVLKGMWTEDEFHFKGDFYRINGGWVKPRPVSSPHPELFQGGNSKAARRMASRVSDWYFMNGNTIEGVREQIEEVSALARQEGRKVKFGLNAFILVRDTEAEAHDVLREIIAQADKEAVEGFGEAVKHAGSSTREKQGMWANSNFEDLVQYNDGFRTGLIGTAEQVADRIRQYYEVGVDLILGGFLHYTDDLPAFGRDVIPLVHQIETRRRSVEELAVA